jgi:hypothetical protein
MWTDEIAEEVRATRDAYAARFDYGLVRIFEDIKNKEQEHPERLADLKPLKRLAANTFRQLRDLSAGASGKE